MSTTTPTGPVPPEHEVFLASLGFARARVLGAVDGLDDTAMRRALLPSGWTPVGLLSHLTRDVEQFWFGAAVAGDPAVIGGLDGPDDGWRPPAAVPAADVVAAYRAACERSDAVIRATPLDTPPAWWPVEQFGGWRLDDLRQVLLHVIVETASHAGHLDAAREFLDGTQWLVLT